MIILISGVSLYILFLLLFYDAYIFIHFCLNTGATYWLTCRSYLQVKIIFGGNWRASFWMDHWGASSNAKLHLIVVQQIIQLPQEQQQMLQWCMNHCGENLLMDLVHLSSLRNHPIPNSCAFLKIGIALQNKASRWVTHLMYIYFQRNRSSAAEPVRLKCLPLTWSSMQISKSTWILFFGVRAACPSSSAK